MSVCETGGVSPDALAEYAAAARYYAAINPELGERYYHGVERLLAEARERPLLYRMFDPPARRHFGFRFPYAVVYLDEPDRVWVVAVMHFKQQPGYWWNRLP